MPKYLYTGSYSAEGVKGAIKEGAVSRRRAFTELVESMGGKVESTYFAFGADDFFITVDLPDNGVASSLALQVSASGAGRLRTVVLLTPEEVDQGLKKQGRYRAPGR